MVKAKAIRPAQSRDERLAETVSNSSQAVDATVTAWARSAPDAVNMGHLRTLATAMSQVCANVVTQAFEAGEKANEPVQGTGGAETEKEVH